MARSEDPVPVLRLVVAAFLAVYVPAHAIAYGFANFLFLCNLSVILAAAGALRAINYAFADPFFKRALGPAPVHVAVSAAALILVAYPPLHVVALRFVPAPQPVSSRP